MRTKHSVYTLSLTALWLIGTATLNGCTRPSNERSVHFSTRMPPKVMSSKLKDKTSTLGTENIWGYSPLTEIGSADCYAISVYGGDLAQGECQGPSATLAISEFYGLYRAGEVVDLDLTPGQNRTLRVYALQSKRDNGECSPAKDFTFNPQDYSQPLLVGSTQLDLVAGDKNLTIDIALAESQAISTCRGPTFSELPNNAWPICAPSVQLAKQIGANEFQISGSCLQGVTAATVKNATSGESTSLVLKSVSSELLRATVSGKFAVASSQAFNLVLHTANADSTVPLTLEFATNSIPITALQTGQVGQVLTTTASGPTWAAPSGGSSSGKRPVLKDGGTEIGEVLQILHGTNTTLNVVDSLNRKLKFVTKGTSSSQLYLANNLGYLNPPFASLAPVDLLKLGYTVPEPAIFFSNSDCSGDILIPTYISDSSVRLVGSYLVIPNSNSTIDPTYKNLPTNLIPQALSSPYQAMLGTYYYGTTSIHTCETSASSLSPSYFSFIIPQASLTPFSGSPTSISNPTLVSE